MSAPARLRAWFPIPGLHAHDTETLGEDLRHAAESMTELHASTEALAARGFALESVYVSADEHGQPHVFSVEMSGSFDSPEAAHAAFVSAGADKTQTFDWSFAA